MMTEVETAASAGLIYVSDGDKGIRRIRLRDGFAYVDHANAPVDDVAVLDRIQRLAIPPAYEDVWICASPRGHLQATGRDARDRKQYRYHPKWRSARDGVKFARMSMFGAALPALRLRVRRDLAKPGMTREKILATVVRLLDTTLVRVGNDTYARENGSFGITTLRNRHVRFVADGRLRFSFRGKGGNAHEVTVSDRRLVQIVHRCHQLPGQRLFQYIDDAGAHHPVDSEQVNDYLSEVTGSEFTAKDFRTWAATVAAAELAASVPLPDPPSERALKACELDVIRTVAGRLRNTPAVCRKSYVNPVVFTHWRAGRLHAIFRAHGRGRTRAAERLALEMLAG